MVNDEPSTFKGNSTIESRGKENKEQNHCQDDSDEHTDNGEKKKKGKEIDLHAPCTYFDKIMI